MEAVGQEQEVGGEEEREERRKKRKMAAPAAESTNTGMGIRIPFGEEEEEDNRAI